MAVPRLQTDRLLLREFRQAEFEAYAAMMADPDVTRYLGDGRPLSRADAWRQMAMFAGHWDLLGFGVWAVEERATGAFIGRVGLMQPEGWPGFELAYTLSRGAWGRGYAREAAGAALEFARQVLRRTSVISIIRPANAASIRVARSLGALPDGETEFFGTAALIYRYPVQSAASSRAPVGIRRATPDDALEMARLFTVLGHPTAADSIGSAWAAWAAEGDAAFVAPREDGTLAGVVTTHVTRVLHRERPVGRITSLVVDAADRGAGLGRRLVAHAEQALAAAGCGMVEVTSNVRRADAHAFYERLGYERSSYRFSRTLA